MTVDEDSPIYRDLMRFKPDELTPNAWAVKAGVSRTVWTDMRRHGNPSRRTLEKLLAAASSSLAEFEALRLGPQASASKRSRACSRTRGRGTGIPPGFRAAIVSRRNWRANGASADPALS